LTERTSRQESTAARSVAPEQSIPLARAALEQVVAAGLADQRDAVLEEFRQLRDDLADAFELLGEQIEQVRQARRPSPRPTVDLTDQPAPPGGPGGPGTPEPGAAHATDSPDALPPGIRLPDAESPDEMVIRPARPRPGHRR